MNLRRRDFITLLGGGAVAWPLAARAQQGERVRRIGVLLPATADDPEWQARVGAFLQALQKRRVTALRIRVVRGQVRKYTNPPHALALLRARRERPHGSTAAEQRDEIASFHLRDHSITSSARASSVGGTSRPSSLAVLRLVTRSYLVGACTGRSAGFSRLRMRST